MDESHVPHETEDAEVRIGRILNEYLDRKARDGFASPSALFAANPDVASELREHLRMLGELCPVGERIDGLIAQGVLEKPSDPRYLADLGSYRIVDWIGVGGMGVVLKAYEESLNRTVALKILRPELSGDATILGRFVREAKAAGTLRHPNIVTMYAVGQERGVHYLAMEYIEGPSLAEVIREFGPLSTDVVRRWFGQLLAGLGAAHDGGLVHRDIKPANLLLDGGSQVLGDRQGPSESLRRSSASSGDAKAVAPPADDSGRGPSIPTSRRRPSATDDPPDARMPAWIQSATLKIVDFGLARMLTARTRLTSEQSVFGTAEYMSPEQARGDPDIDHRTDLYSAGVVLYEMLTGRTPFRTDVPSAVAHRILHEDPADPRSLNAIADARLAGLALRLTAKRPADRFASATEAIAAMESSTVVRLLERRRRQRRLALAVAAACLAVALGALPLGYWWARGRTITDARVDPDTHQAIQVRLGDDPAWHHFKADLPPKPFLGSAMLLHAAGARSPTIMATFSHPIGEEGCLVAAFDSGGRRLWQKSLAPAPDIDWADCPKQKSVWTMPALAIGDLDGRPGDEVAVSARDSDCYGARVSLLDSASGEIKATCWHAGHITGLGVLEGYFDDGRPALIVWGIANKLDGWGDPVPADYDGPRWTDYAKVPVVMILDPMDMGGAIPPLSAERSGLQPVNPVAYAFLDLSFDATAFYCHTERRLRKPEAWEIAYIDSVRVAPSRGPAVEVALVAYLPSRSDAHRATVSLGSDLSFLSARTSDFDARRDPAFWRQHWHPIIQNRRCVEEPHRGSAR